MDFVAIVKQKSAARGDRGLEERIAEIRDRFQLEEEDFNRY